VTNASSRLKTAYRNFLLNYEEAHFGQDAKCRQPAYDVHTPITSQQKLEYHLAASSPQRSGIEVQSFDAVTSPSYLNRRQQICASVQWGHPSHTLQITRANILKASPNAIDNSIANAR